jgi:hypothetical protein
VPPVHPSCLNVLPATRTARTGERLITTMVIRPAMSMSVPADESQLKLKVGVRTGLPPAVGACKPGHSRLAVHGDSASFCLMSGICAIENIPMMIK